MESARKNVKKAEATDRDENMCIGNGSTLLRVYILVCVKYEADW